MRALVVYESLFGNNRSIAGAITAGIGDHADVTLTPATYAPAVIPSQVDLLVVGGPNHAFGLPRPATRRDAQRYAKEQLEIPERGLREWLAALVSVPTGLVAAVYDTRVVAPRFIRLLDHASSTIERRLRDLGVDLVGDPEHFYVMDAPGPLVPGELNRATEWGAKLAERMAPIG